MAFTRQLLNVGLSKNEVTIYEKLLTVGAQPVGVLAKRIQINRSTIYSVLKGLKLKGIVSSYQQDTVEFFMANSPNSIIGYIDRKVKVLDYYRCAVLNEIPKLKSGKTEYSATRPLVRHFDGEQGVSEVMDDALTASELLMFSPLREWGNGSVGEFLLKYMSLRTASSKVRIITVKTETTEQFFKKHFRRNGQIDVLFLSEKDKMGCSSVENSVKMYENKVSMVNVDGDGTHGVIIESKGISRAHRYIFELLWRNLKNKQ